MFEDKNSEDDASHNIMKWHVVVRTQPLLVANNKLLHSLHYIWRVYFMYICVRSTRYKYDYVSFAHTHTESRAKHCCHYTLNIIVIKLFWHVWRLHNTTQHNTCFAFYIIF